jgi:c-di-GMP-binding flagellar brake protein YcgR
MSAEQDPDGNDAAPSALPADDPLAPYSTDERPAILQVLQRLAQSNLPVRAQLHGSDRLVLTAVIEVDGEADRLLLDYGPDEAVNRQLLRSGRATVSGHVDGIRVVFPVTALRALSLDDGPVFAAPLPAWLARVQRRRFFRLPVSGDESMQCRVEDAEGGIARYQVLDLSVGGVALLETDADAVETWEPGRVLRDVTLEAGNAGEVRLDLEVCHGRQRAGARREQGCIGCRFLALSGPTAAWLERLIRDRERARLARSSRHRGPQ